MFGQLSLDVMLLLMLYAAGTATAFIACLYLLLRQGNAFARRVKTPDRLRLWTAAFFGIVAAGHQSPGVACLNGALPHKKSLRMECAEGVSYGFRYKLT